jgi:hypothetical protein
MRLDFVQSPRRRFSAIVSKVEARSIKHRRLIVSPKAPANSQSIEVENRRSGLMIRCPGIKPMHSPYLVGRETPIALGIDRSNPGIIRSL